MDKVIVMLTAYNGEQYLPFQIDSILSQDYENLVLLIRDDGSKDNTTSIIKDYVQKDSRVVFVCDDRGNVRQCKSFEILVEYALKHYPNEIYMFSDHDDVWYEDKISTELQYLNKDTPCMVYTNYEITNRDLEVQDIAYHSNIELSGEEYRRAIIMQNYIMGCTMMVNYQLLKNSYPFSDYADNHDQYISTIASFIGEIVYCDKITLKHRLHSNNVTTRENTSKASNKIKRVLKRISDRKTYFDRQLNYVNSIKSLVSDCDNAQESFLLDELSEAFTIRGNKGWKILAKNNFKMHNSTQNKILKVMFLLN